MLRRLTLVEEDGTVVVDLVGEFEVALRPALVGEEDTQRVEAPMFAGWGSAGPVHVWAGVEAKAPLALSMVETGDGRVC